MRHFEPSGFSAFHTPVIHRSEAVPGSAFVLPSPPPEGDGFERDVFNRFMHHVRAVPNRRMEIKILSAISFTADALSCGDELAAKMLADMGLRAPRRAFPASFLQFADNCLARARWDGTSLPPSSVTALYRHWMGPASGGDPEEGATLN